MNVKEIVENYLKREGFDGLVFQDIPCGCLVGDLYGCGNEIPLDCEPGHKHDVDPADNDGAEWLVYPGKCGPDCPRNLNKERLKQSVARVGAYSSPEWIEEWFRRKERAMSEDNKPYTKGRGSIGVAEERPDRDDGKCPGKDDCSILSAAHRKWKEGSP